MNHSKFLSRLLVGLLSIMIVSSITFSGCTKFNGALGSDLTLENQSLKLGQVQFSALDGDNFIEARLYRTDSINTANIGIGYLGTMGNDTFGMRQAGFYSQYLPSYTISDDLFGHMPIFDSAMLYLSLSSYGGDTSVVQYYEVYEVIDDNFIAISADSVFFPNFDISEYLADAPVFTFAYPDQDNEIYTGTSSLRLTETDKTEEFMSRLMMEAKTEDYDYEIYDDEEEWLTYFKGLYIRPVAALEPTNGSSTGAMYSFDLTSSGFGFYGRNREETDPTLIKDTTGMTYIFYSSYAEYGNVSINMIEHNYDNSLIDETLVKGPDPDVAEFDGQLTSVIRVEGLAGVVTELKFTEDLFTQLDTILATEEDESGEAYTNLFFNQAMLRIYMQEVDGYDPAAIDPFRVTDWMNYMPANLGLYSNYSYYYYTDEDDEDDTYISLTGVADYVYAYESSYTLDFGGALNRSWGCYVMNISSHMQSIWNEYLAAKETAEEDGVEIDWDDLEYRVMYLGPTATNLFSTYYASLQAGDSSNTAPIQLDLTYTMTR